MTIENCFKDMYETLFKTFEKLIVLSDEERQIITEILKPLDIKKGECFQKWTSSINYLGVEPRSISRQKV